MPKYYITFYDIPSGKFIIDAEDEQSAIYKAIYRMDEDAIKWIENQVDINNSPMIPISVGEAGFVDF